MLSSSGVGIGMMMVETTSSSITDQAFPVPGRSSNRSSAMLPSFHRAEQYSLAAITAIDSLGFDPPPKYSKADPLEWSSTT